VDDGVVIAKTDRGALDRVARLGAEIVGVDCRSGAEHIPVAALEELRRDRDSGDHRGAGEIGVRLVLDAKRDKPGEAVWRAQPVDLGKISLDSLPDLGWRVRRQRPVEIGASDFKGTEPE